MRPKSPPPPSLTLEAIASTPAAVRRLIESGWDEAEKAARALKRRRRLFLAGSGTSYHAAWAGSHLFRAVAGLDAYPLQAFELSLYPPKLGPEDAVLVVSHRGNKRFSVAGLEKARKAGTLLLGVTGAGSGLPGADFVFPTVEQERSSAHTVSYVGALAVLAKLAYACGPGADEGLKLLGALPKELEALLARAHEVEAPAARAVEARRVIAVGGGPNAATASEAALKLIEMAHLPAQAYELETFLHGPLASVEPRDFVVTISVPGPCWSRAEELHAALKTIGCGVWCVGESLSDVPDFELPDLPEPLTPLAAVLPLQLLAHRAARVRGVNPDVNRRDNETYKAAMAKYAL